MTDRNGGPSDSAEVRLALLQERLAVLAATIKEGQRSQDDRWERTSRKLEDLSADVVSVKGTLEKTREKVEDLERQFVQLKQELTGEIQEKVGKDTFGIIWKIVIGLGVALTISSQALNLFHMIGWLR